MNYQYRYERKFFISGLTHAEVESIVRYHPAMFSEIYHQRYVNNIYFDTATFSCFLDNVIGSTNRAKFRIRWYGDIFTFIKDPILELKIKNGLLGRKKRYPLVPFSLDSSFDSRVIGRIIADSDLPDLVQDALKSSNPVLLNRYSRRYFSSADGRYRITIDTDQEFYWIGRRNNSFLNKVKNDIDVILELKYDEDADDTASYIANHFPFRLTKSSKYVSGTLRLYVG